MLFSIQGKSIYAARHSVVLNMSTSKYLRKVERQVFYSVSLHDVLKKVLLPNNEKQLDHNN